MKEAKTICERCERERICFYVPDPFCQELYGDESLHWLCDSCFVESQEDI